MGAGGYGGSLGNMGGGRMGSLGQGGGSPPFVPPGGVGQPPPGQMLPNPNRDTRPRQPGDVAPTFGGGMGFDQPMSGHYIGTPEEQQRWATANQSPEVIAAQKQQVLAAEGRRQGGSPPFYPGPMGGNPGPDVGPAPSPGIDPSPTQTPGPDGAPLGSKRYPTGPKRPSNPMGGWEAGGMPANQPAPPPTMPLGQPPPQPGMGGAPVNGQPASVGASPAANAQAAMMKRAGVRAAAPSVVPPKPNA